MQHREIINYFAQISFDTSILMIFGALVIIAVAAGGELFRFIQTYNLRNASAAA